MNALEMMGESEILDAEREKYIRVYDAVATYGHTNHAQGIYWYLEERLDSYRNAMFVAADIGCGYCEFLQWLRSKSEDFYLYGVDIAVPIDNDFFAVNDITFVRDAAWNLIFANKSVDLLTAFDVLEHIPAAMLKTTLAEFDRVCKGEMIFSIGHRSSKKIGIELHQTIQAAPWWHDLLETHFPGRVQIAISRHSLASEYFIVSPP